MWSLDRFARTRSIVLIVLGYTSTTWVHAKTPDWAKENTLKLSGALLTTVCSGSGPSIDIAKKVAIDSCKSSARQHIPTESKIRSLTIQTETSSGFHEEVSDHAIYQGLECTPLKDSVEEAEGSFNVWVQCRFDLSKVKVAQVNDEKPTELNQTSSITNRESLKQLKDTGPISNGTHYFGKRTVLSISSVPSCTTLMIRGLKPRTVDCDKNPLEILLEDGDTEIIIRANGYEPKTISLGTGRKSHETVHVILNPL